MPGRLRCDRNRPCDSCVRRGLSLSCTYVDSANSTRSDDRIDGPYSSSDPQATIQSRISQLEELILNLMNQTNARISGQRNESIEFATNDGPGTWPRRNTGSSGRESPGWTPDQVSDRLGHINLADNETTYVDSAHWTALLDGVGQLL